MKKHIFLVLGVLLSVTLSVSAAVVTWQGGDGNWLGNANWDVGGTANQNLPDQTAQDDEIIINGGNTVYNPGADFGLNWGATDITVNGGSVTQSTTHWWRFNGTGTFTVDGGDVNAGASNVQLGESASDSASLILKSGVFNHSGGGEFKVRGSNTVSVEGGELISRFFSIGDFGPATFDLSAGKIQLTNGGISHNGIYGSYINFTEGSTGVFNVGNISVLDATTAYLDSNKVRYNGAVSDAMLSVTADGAGGVNITAIPEPSSLALVLVSVLGGLLIRRKRT